MMCGAIWFFCGLIIGVVLGYLLTLLLLVILQQYKDNDNNLNE